MKREIKFRAWHKAEKMMCKVENINSIGCYLYGVKKGEDQYTDNGKQVIIAPEDGRFCLHDEIELMQFTGLYDKNGKEIYEGDFVDISQFEETSIWRIQITDIRKLPHEHMGSDTDWIKVIGNIYETPDLLVS